MKKNQRGFGVIELVLIVVVIGLLGAIGWFVWDQQQSKDSSSNNQETSQTSTTKNSDDSQKSSSSDTAKKSDDTSATSYDTAKASHIEGFDLATTSLKSALLNTFYDDAKKQCEEAAKDSSGGITSATPYIKVFSVVRDDFATAQWCGSGAKSVIANLSSGSWKVVASLGEAPSCSVVDQYKISREIVPNCLNSKGSLGAVSYQ